MLKMSRYQESATLHSFPPNIMHATGLHTFGQCAPRIRLIVIFNFDSNSGAGLGVWKVHLVDTNLFWGGVSCAVLPYTSRGSFRWQAYCNEPNAARIMNYGRIYHSGNGY